MAEPSRALAEDEDGRTLQSCWLRFNEPSPMVLAAALAHARAEAPREACGLVVGGAYLPCRNIAANPANTFILCPDDYLAASNAGRIEMIVHSHPSGDPAPSDHDRVACDGSGLPWLIVEPINGTRVTMSARGLALPLVGRPWVWGVADCWGLVRDWYQRERGIILPDCDRPATPEQFQSAPLFDQLWRDFGFKQVDPDESIEVGDVPIMSIGGPGLNHVGVIVENGQILHHLRGRLSGRDIYGGWLQRCTGRIVRYAP